MSIVRISLGRFEAHLYEAIRQKLDESQAVLIPAIKALKGNVAFYAAIDRENGVMSNVSVWETMPMPGSWTRCGPCSTWRRPSRRPAFASSGRSPITTCFGPCDAAFAWRYLDGMARLVISKAA